jgi:hypothetical protein
MPLVKIPGRDVGIHALIIGVSDYTYLPGDDDPVEGGSKLGMKKLKTPALGAFRFLQWLQKADAAAGADAKVRLNHPLASYDVILAASPEERAILGLSDWVEDATTDKVVERIREWRERVAENPDNVALFYFSGHGIQRNKEDAVLMLQDFAQSKAAMLEHAISFFEIFSGMAPSDDYSNMGMTQLYFVDACRNLPEQIKNFAKLNTQPVFDNYLGGRDDRMAPVFFSAVNDSKAFAEVGLGSYFNRALLAALECGAENSRDCSGVKCWPLSVFTLTTAISNEFENFDIKQNFVPAGQFRDFDVCLLAQAPQVDMVIQVVPENQRANTTVEVKQMGVHDPFSWRQSVPPPAHPYRVTAPAGIHNLIATVAGVTLYDSTEFINQKNRRWPVQL